MICRDIYSLSDLSNKKINKSPVCRNLTIQTQSAFFCIFGEYTLPLGYSKSNQVFAICSSGIGSVML